MSTDDRDDRDERDDDRDDDDRPRRRSRRDYEPHRGALVLVLGILGLIACGPIGIAAWLMGKSDLKKIDAGTMDPEGRQMTQIGMILGIVATILTILGLCFAVVYFIFFVAIIGAAVNNAPKNPPVPNAQPAPITEPAKPVTKPKAAPARP